MKCQYHINLHAGWQHREGGDTLGEGGWAGDIHSESLKPVAHHSLCLLQVFSTVDPSLSVTWTAKDGDHVTSGTKFGTVKGSARSILIAERIALNFTQRMSGIATATAAMVEQMKAGACFLPSPDSAFCINCNVLHVQGPLSLYLMVAKLSKWFVLCFEYTFANCTYAAAGSSCSLQS